MSEVEQAEQSFAEYKAARFAPAPEAVPIVDTPEPEAKTDEPTPIEPKAEKQPNPKLEKRFSELTAKRDAALQEAATHKAERERLEARLRELEGGQKAEQPQAKTAGEPNPDDYESPHDYAKAVVKHELEQREQHTKELSSQEATEKAWNERLAAARAEIPDLDELVASADVNITGLMAEVMKDSEVGPHILYHLAEHPELAEKITQMSPRDQVREMGRLEAKLAKAEAPQAQVSKAPPPITPLKGGNGGNESYENTDGEFTGSFAQYKALRRAGKIK